MLFNSFIFLFCFLPVTYAVFWLLRTAKSRYIWLTITGYIFYGYWNPRFTLLMAFSTAVSFSVSGAFAATYSTIFSMMPIALAARDASGPAEIVFTRQPNLRPASNASVRVSLSSAAFADDMPPP